MFACSINSPKSGLLMSHKEKIIDMLFQTAGFMTDMIKNLRRKATAILVPIKQLLLKTQKAVKFNASLMQFNEC